MPTQATKIQRVTGGILANQPLLEVGVALLARGLLIAAQLGH